MPAGRRRERHSCPGLRQRLEVLRQLRVERRIRRSAPGWCFAPLPISSIALGAKPGDVGVEVRGEPLVQSPIESLLAESAAAILRLGLHSRASRSASGISSSGTQADRQIARAPWELLLAAIDS
jgi:hypothetical protein